MKTRTLTLCEAAERWMDENPLIMGYFKRFAIEAMNRSRKFGAKQLAERVRWECWVSAPDKPPKINNNHVAYIARRLLREIPGLHFLIECRITKAANRPAKVFRTTPVIDPHLNDVF